MGIFSLLFGKPGPTCCLTEGEGIVAAGNRNPSPPRIYPAAYSYYWECFGCKYGFFQAGAPAHCPKCRNIFIDPNLVIPDHEILELKHDIKRLGIKYFRNNSLYFPQPNGDIWVTGSIGSFLAITPNGNVTTAVPRQFIWNKLKELQKE